MIKIEGYISTNNKRTSFSLFSIYRIPRGLKVKNWASLIDILNEFGSANDYPAISFADNIV